jgi:cytosine/adenosine deaminase-related metal-dependent hydrolase
MRSSPCCPGKSSSAFPWCRRFSVSAEDHLGTLEPGKLADIITLDKSPLEDIKKAQSIRRVIKGGWVFNPEALKTRQIIRLRKVNSLSLN